MKKLLFILFMYCAMLSGCAKEEINLYGGIYGTVRDMETGSVIYNAEITLLPGNPSPITGTNGAYEFQNLEARQYTLTVRASGYLDDSRQVVVVPGENIRCDVLLSPELEIEEFSLSTKTLNFGSDITTLSLTIYNRGNAGFNWNVANANYGWLNISPTSGYTNAGKSSDITVSVNRSKISDDTSSSFIINAAGGSKSVTVYVNGQNNGGNGNSGENGDDDTINDPANVTNGLFGYYKFEGNCNNSVDGAPNGQGINDPTYTTGMKGSKALKLSVVENSYFSIPKGVANLLDFGNFSISLWIKGLNDGHIFHTEDTNKHPNDLLIMKDGYLTYKTDYNTNTFHTFAHNRLDQSKWYMITITAKRDGTKIQIKLYIDGEYIDIIPDTFSTFLYEKLKFIVGGVLQPISYGNSGSMAPPSMTIDNLRIYNSRTLSDAEIKQIYNYEK